MSQPTIREELFHDISERARHIDLMELDAYEAFIEADLAAARTRYPFMRDMTIVDYHAHFLYALQRDIDDAKAQPSITAQDFWKAAYDYDP
ncbi:MAG: hypothetical protein Q9222_004251 [Ikaeria aurantiellina]